MQFWIVAENFRHINIFDKFSASVIIWKAPKNILSVNFFQKLYSKQLCKVFLLQLSVVNCFILVASFILFLFKAIFLTYLFTLEATFLFIVYYYFDIIVDWQSTPIVIVGRRWFFQFESQFFRQSNVFAFAKVWRNC